MKDEQKAHKSGLKQIEPETSSYECFFHYTDELLYSAGFREGEQTKEEELQNLAIEFAEWVGKNHHLTKHPTEPEIWTNYTENYTTAELFTKFITERNK